jgi:hemerythrin-like domain-containing protein
MTTPTQVLRDEHRLILRVLALIESATARLAAGGALPDGWWNQALSWLREFADHNHHGKEERGLFPALAKAGVPVQGGPVGVMLAEHERGRALLRAMDTGDPRSRLEAARDYVQLLREHIDKENGVLFPLAEAVLDEPVRQALAREFEALEIEQGREASIDHAEAAVERLEQAIG